MTDDGSTEGEENGEPEEEPVDFLANIEETLRKIESKEDEADLGPTLSKLDDIEDVLDEAEDVLSTMDLSELSHAVDWGALPDAVNVSALPDAVGDGDVGDAVDALKLLSAVDLSKLFDSVDERELWRQKREFDAEDTGTHFLDSGGAYGRHWEENQNNPPWERLRIQVGDGYVVKNVYHHLTEHLSRDEQCQVHQGCDVRGGYTVPSVYKVRDALLPSEFCFRCETCGWEEAESMLYGEEWPTYLPRENRLECTACGGDVRV